jgi:hypothetical protein
MFGDLDERTHRLFKLSMLHASLYTVGLQPRNIRLELTYRYSWTISLEVITWLNPCTRR